MSNQPTPETDAIDNLMCNFEHYNFAAPVFDLARNLERQRDDAIEALEQIARDGDRPMSTRVASPASIARATIASITGKELL